MTMNMESCSDIEPHTLAELVESQHRWMMPEQARRNAVAGINTVARVIGRAPHLIDIDIASLQKEIAAANPGAFGVSASRWRNAKSDLRRAQRSAGLLAERKHFAPIADCWQELVAAVPNPVQQSIMRRFARYCGGRGLAPIDVSDRVAADYLVNLRDVERSKRPEKSFKDLILVWNRFAHAGDGGVMASLSKGLDDRTYSLRWPDLPAGLAADAKRFFDRSTSPDWFSVDAGLRAVRPATANQQDRMLRRLASAALQGGVNAEALTSLGELVRPERLRPALEFMIERNGGSPNRQVFEMAVLAQTIAQRWAKLPDDETTIVAQWVRKFRPTKTGMTAKNRERLRQFTSADVIGQLVNLPVQVFRQVASRPITPTSARRAQRALMIAILTAAPMRLNNLRLLDRTRHFKQPFSVTVDRWHLTLPAAEVKNDIDLEYPVDPRLMAMIDLYMRDYQPVLSPEPNTFLFPGRRADAAISDGGIRRAIVEFASKEAGLVMNPHLFRHLAALIFLKANPGQYEAARQLLGHKNIQTTIEFYTGFETDEAAARYGTVLSGYTKVQQPVHGREGRAAHAQA